MACGPGGLQDVSSPFSFSRLGNPLYVEEPWFWGCGQTNVSCKVVKGKLVEVGKWPWQVSILFLGVYICSGSLLHRQWVLTAAHCFQRSLDPKQYSVMVGVRYLAETGSQLELARIVIHEDYKDLLSDDLALLKLADPVAWSALVQPVCLPPTKYMPPLGTLCWTIVWGHPSRKDEKATTKPSYSLQEVSVKIVKNEICDRQYQFLFLNGKKQLTRGDMLCASSQWGVDSCQTNSGSSLVCQENKTWIQMGVESWSFSCKSHRYPNIYTSTSHFTQWIKKHIEDLDVKFTSGANPTFLSLVFLSGCVLLVSLSCLWLL